MDGGGREIEIAQVLSYRFAGDLTEEEVEPFWSGGFFHERKAMAFVGQEEGLRQSGVRQSIGGGVSNGTGYIGDTVMDNTMADISGVF